MAAHLARLWVKDPIPLWEIRKLAGVRESVASSKVMVSVPVEDPGALYVRWDDNGQ